MRNNLTPYAFFLKHAGYPRRPTIETIRQGRARNAHQLATAENAARNLGISFVWEHDVDTDSSDFCNEGTPWLLWVCFAYDEDGVVVASLGGIDFGRDGVPQGNPYRRVIEAELALEVISARKG